MRVEYTIVFKREFSPSDYDVTEFGYDPDEVSFSDVAKEILEEEAVDDPEFILEMGHNVDVTVEVLD